MCPLLNHQHHQLCICNRQFYQRDRSLFTTDCEICLIHSPYRFILCTMIQYSLFISIWISVLLHTAIFFYDFFYVLLFSSRFRFCLWFFTILFIDYLLVRSIAHKSSTSSASTIHLSDRSVCFGNVILTSRRPLRCLRWSNNDHWLRWKSVDVLSLVVGVFFFSFLVVFLEVESLIVSRLLLYRRRGSSSLLFFFGVWFSYGFNSNSFRTHFGCAPWLFSNGSFEKSAIQRRTRKHFDKSQFTNYLANYIFIALKWCEEHHFVWKIHTAHNEPKLNHYARISNGNRNLKHRQNRNRKRPIINPNLFTRFVVVFCFCFCFTESNSQLTRLEWKSSEKKKNPLSSNQNRCSHEHFIWISNRIKSSNE